MLPTSSSRVSSRLKELREVREEERDTWWLLFCKTAAGERGRRAEGEQARLVMEVEVAEVKGTTGDNLSNRQFDDGELRANTKYTLKLFVFDEKYCQQF